LNQKFGVKMRNCSINNLVKITIAIMVLSIQLLSDDIRISELKKLDWKTQPEEYKISDKATIKTTKDDWSENIDKDKMLEEIKQGTLQSNKQRKKGYLNNTVYWAIAGHDEEHTKFINAKALKLGRKGYTEILWIGSPEQFSSSDIVLKPLLSNYKYNNGF
jgi:uncharacterized membrane-anchored protein